MCWVFVAVQGPPLVETSGGYSVVVRGLLIAVAYLVVKHGPYDLWASVDVGSGVVILGLSCP